MKQGMFQNKNERHTRSDEAPTVQMLAKRFRHMARDENGLPVEDTGNTLSVKKREKARPATDVIIQDKNFKL